MTVADTGTWTLVRRYIIRENQRTAIEDYLSNRPNLMPDNVRAMRKWARRLNFELIRSDLELLEELANLDVKIGRKKDGYADRMAKVIVRQRGSEELKAHTEIRGQSRK